ncbi:hypothetical protein CesoFtcFv8_009515 [Champsocephalus esox]|uniref:Uncharacterized protein n=1 Tax=Champsocephalus esox TaxID=159716 RepID=A0AAN8H1R9_9TELE|nr:hypothetical protein CesoFtcFv8_009515 [Champsocephalus esox]
MCWYCSKTQKAPPCSNGPNTETLPSPQHPDHRPGCVHRYVPLALVPPVEPLYTRDSSEDMSLLFSQCDTAMRVTGIPCESLSRPSQVSRERSAAKMALPWPVMLHARERVLLSGHAPGVCVVWAAASS